MRDFSKNSSSWSAARKSAVHPNKYHHWYCCSWGLAGACSGRVEAVGKNTTIIINDAPGYAHPDITPPACRAGGARDAAPAAAQIQQNENTNVVHMPVLKTDQKEQVYHSAKAARSCVTLMTATATPSYHLVRPMAAAIEPEDDDETIPLSGGRAAMERVLDEDDQTRAA